MKETGKDRQLTNRTGNLLSRVASLMQLSFDRRLKKYGVTRSQWMVVAVIFGNEAETAADIAKIWKLDATAVTRLIDRLEAKGFVKRTYDGADRRINKLELTEEGQRLAPILKNVADKNHDYVFGVLSAPEEKHLRELLSIILKQLSSVGE